MLLPRFLEKVINFSQKSGQVSRIELRDELSHSEISGSKVARHLPEAYRSHATSFIAFLCQGILHAPLYE